MGEELFNLLKSLTGLPDELIGRELERLLAAHGKTADTMTLEDLRLIMADYVQDVLLEAKENHENTVI